MITTRRMLMLYACLVPVALTGCDLADYFPNVPQPVPVISPGYQVDIDGHPVRISGFDDCPREKDEARHAAAQDEKGCIVLSAERSEVKVRLYQPAGAVTETWRIIREKTGMYTLMSNKQRQEWDRQVAGEEMPPITLENVMSTFRHLNASKADTFTQGLIDIFKSLSWDYKTNNPCMFGKRIIIAPLLDVWRSGWVRFSSDGHTKIDDLARPFYVLDGRNVPDYRVSDGAKLDAFFSENQFNGKVFECDYFSVRYYKKGSAHITFKRPELVEKINNLVASHYPGMLPPRV
ncbi:DUF4942 domain-containing protein [Klebsiella pneumoniae]